MAPAPAPVAKSSAGYGSLPAAAQVRLLRGVAFAALRDYPFDVRRVRLLLHGYNTTFRVDTTDGRRFALRLNVLPRKSIAQLDAEAAWLTALAAETDLTVPAPVPTIGGRPYTSVDAPALRRVIPATVMSWLPGRDLEQPDMASMRALGRVTATLHRHAETWTIPAGAELPAIDTVLMNVSNHLQPERGGAASVVSVLTPGQRQVIDAALDQVQRHYDELLAGTPRIALHADLHGGNLKWLRGRLAVFDFDDAGIGVPAQDLAISAYYLRDAEQLEAALLDGYREVRPLPSFTAAQFEAVVASRNLVLLNDVVVAEHAEYRALARTYVPNTVTKLRAYLDTGVYRHDVPGLLVTGD